MAHMKEISISGVLSGFVVVVATTIVLSILSPIIFTKLVQSGDMDILLTSTGPLVYAVFVLLVSTAFGVFVCHKVAGSPFLVNTILVVVLYAAFSYLLSTAPSNEIKPYPLWYVVTTYLVLIPGAYVGHQLAVRLVGKGKQVD